MEDNKKGAKSQIMNQINHTNRYIGKKYKLTKCLGKGAFGEIYHAYDVKSLEEYAIKLEPKK
jgi:serine/threonine protein kinase